MVTKRIEIKGILYFHDSNSERIKALIEMVELNVQGCEAIVEGIEQLP